MAINFPGPYEVEFRYTTSGVQHTARYNCDVTGTPVPGDLPSAIAVNLRNGSTLTLDVIIANWVLLLDSLFHTSTTFDDYTFWKYTPLTYDRTFITTASIGSSGTGTNPTNLSHAIILTMRTIEGGVMKLNFMESLNVQISRLTYAASGPDVRAIFDFVTGLTNWVLARDTSYPIASIHSLGGENEAIFKKRNR